MISKKSTYYAIGVDLGGTNVRVGIVSSKGKIITSLKKSVPAVRNKTTLPSLISELISQTLKLAAAKKIKIKGIGFGSPGILDLKKGIVCKSPNLPEWKNYPLAEFFKKRFKIPFVLENDANAAALGEAWIGAGKKADTVICITLGTGVGGGIILNHAIWHGRDGGAGEIGHMVVRDNGLKCRCGNYGCLEMYASATAIAQKAKLLLKQSKQPSRLRQLDKITSQGIFASAKKKDKLALKVVLEAAEVLGAGISSLVHIFNPDMIVVGGGVSENGNTLFTPLRKNVKKRSFPQLTRHLKIVPANLGDHAGMIGAAKALFNSI